LTNNSFKSLKKSLSMANLQEKTSIYKSFHGWKGETFTTINEQAYVITTLKTYSKKIVSSAKMVQLLEGGGYQYEMLNSENSFDLLKEDAKATQSKITELHTKALLIFDEKIQGQEITKPYTIQKGQIIFLNGYGQNEHSYEKKAIYEIKQTNFGTFYKFVNLDTLELGTAEHIRPANEIFGIGTYYHEGEKISDETLQNAVIDAKAKELKEAKEKAATKLLENLRESVKIEQGEKDLIIPAKAKAVIIAQFMTDESDSQTDYFHSSVKKTVYLAFSNHKRDLFAEMRKACKNTDIAEIRAFSVVPEINQNGETKSEYIKKMVAYYKDEKEAGKYWNPEDENRHKYSMGDGYYLGEKYSRSGWRVRKDYLDLTSERGKNTLAIAKSEGRYFCQPESSAATTTTTTTTTSEKDLIYINYSEKAFAIIGETKPVKDKLKSLGGRFNFRLKCGAGWIFSKKKESEVLKELNICKDVATS
jgi:hypothetical protein